MSYDSRWHRTVTITGVNINSAGSDNTILLPPGIGKWALGRLRIYDASTALAVSIATLGLFTGAGGTGTTLVTAATVTALTAATKFTDMTLAITADYQTATTIYLRNVTAHGSAATVSAALSWDYLG